MNSGRLKVSLGRTVVLCLLMAIAFACSAATASAQLIQSVAVDPRVDASLDVSASQALPGANVPAMIDVSNSGATLSLTGRVNYFGSIFTSSTVRSWYAVVEARNGSGAWAPIAGAANAAAGYAPRGLPGIATGLSFTAQPVPLWGVTYPAASDKLIGTRLAGLTLASWNHTAKTDVSPALLANLLNPDSTSQVRLRVHIEAARNGLFGSQYIDVQERVSTFGKMLRSQSGLATDLQLDLAVNGSPVTHFDSSTHAELAALSSGSSAAVATSIALPGVAPKAPSETDGEYLARLREAAAAQTVSAVNGSFTAGGVATPACWWLLFDFDPTYDIGGPRPMPIAGDLAATQSKVPVLEITKTGPPEVDAGAQADYEITVANTGDAAGDADVIDEVDGHPAAAVTGFGAIAAGQSQTGTHTVQVPTSLSGGQLHDRASVTWTDSDSNQYGPVSAEFTSLLTTDTTPPGAPAITLAPSALTNQTGAEFQFTGEDGGTYRCGLDGAPPEVCLSPHFLSGLADGNHTFSVFQIDDAGNAGSVTGLTWVIDSQPPAAPQVAGAPVGSTQSQAASITFEGELAATFSCSIDSAPATTCASPLELSGLTEGPHSVEVIQADAAGNQSPQAFASWEVDLTAPLAPHLDSTPAPLTNETTAGFGYTGEPGGSFQCRLDGAVFATCPNPRSYESVADGNHDFEVRQVDAAGNQGAVTHFAWTIDTDAPQPPSITSPPVNPTTERSVSVGFEGEPGGSFECSLDGAPDSACVSPASYDELTEGQHSFSVVQIDAAGNRGGVATTSWEVVPSGQAPPIDQNGVAPFTDQVEFLYEGPNAVQQGVATGAIDDRRVSVIRGTVRDRNGDPLSEARVEVLGESEFGYTSTDADGVFSLAANGGSTVRIRIGKDGYMAVVREVVTKWNDYSWADDTVLLQPVAQSTQIDLSLPTSQAQVAQGPVETDEDGSRQATLIFNPGTQASMDVAGTGTVPLPSLTVRATEVTVGASGPDAMPAPMAPNIAYTYAAAFTVDQAEAAGAESVSFSQPVISYTDNFLNMPVGESVPAGYLDPSSSRWLAQPSGRVIEVLAETGAVAQLDLTGGGVAATQTQLDDLGVTQAELQSVADRFDPGQSFWRVPLSHFSFWDFNWGFGPPGDADNDGIPDEDECSDCEPVEGGSIIGVQTQSLGESIDLPGTEFSLNYLSRKSRGYSYADKIKLALTNGTISDKLRGIVVKADIAGQQITQELAPAVNLDSSITWDRKDGFGRDVNGPRTAHIKIGYVYEGVYQRTERFGYNGNGTEISGSRTRQEVTLWRNHEVTVGGFDAMAASLGGWTLNAEHYYDRATGTLYRGGDNERLAGSAGLVTESLMKGVPAPRPPGSLCGLPIIPGPAISSYLCDGRGVEAGPSGTVYLTDTANGLFSIDRDGTLRKLEGQRSITGTRCGYPNDFTWLPLHTQQLAVDSAENVYYSDEFNCVIWKRSPSGAVTRAVGGGGNYSPADGTLGTDASFNWLGDIAVGPDSTLYFTDKRNYKIYHLLADGTLEVVAGDGFDGETPDGAAAVGNPMRLRGQSLAVGSDGTIYFDEYSNLSRVRAVLPTGRLKTIAGGSVATCSSSSSSGVATSIGIGSIAALESLRDGSLAVADYCGGGHVLRRVDPNGHMSTIAGQSDRSIPTSGEGGNAPRNHILAFDVDEAPDGSILIASGGSIRSIHPRRPEAVGLNENVTVVGDDESELLEFDPLGRHLRTVNAMTGRTEYTFARDSAGRLTSVTDGDGNVTSIARNASGSPSAITGPFGRTTSLSTDPSGRLTATEDQLGNRFEMSYDAAGLLASFRLPNGATSNFTYEPDGRIARDENALGGYKQLTRSESLSIVDQTDREEVTVQTAAGRQRTYMTEKRPDGSEFEETTHSDGTKTESTRTSEATSTSTSADGTVFKTERAPDPRYGMLAPFASAASVETPSGKKLTYSHQRSVNQSDPEDPATLVSQTDSVSVNGKTSVTAYTKATRTYTGSSPAGRTNSVQTDAGSRPTQVSVPGINPFTFGYDAQGRATTTTQGSRQATYAYNSSGDLSQVTDSLGRITTFDYDAAGRLTAEHRPGGRTVEYTYDENGNVTSIKPPSKPAHTFAFNPLGMLTAAELPEAAATPRSTTYAYATPDHDLTKITRPDGQAANFAYDSAGRLSTVTDSEGPSTFTYSPTTGNMTTLSSPGNENLAFTFDGSLPTTQTLTGQVAGSSTLTFNNDFQLTSATTAASPVNFAYDADGLRTQAGALTLASDPQNGLLKTLSLANTSTQITHNPYGEPDSIDTDISGADLFELNLTRDNAGRITTKQEIRPSGTTTWAYNYDAAGRLENVIKDGAQYAAYSYDANSNRTANTVEGVPTYATFDTRDRMLTQGDLDLTYNANGELTTKRDRTTGETLELDYTTLGDLKSATTSDGRQIEYLLDGAGRRVGKKVDSQLVQGLLYSPEANGPVAELDGSNNLVARFIYGRSSNVPDYMVKGGVSYRLITDQLGSVVMVVDAQSGSVMQEITYGPFGEVLSDSNPNFQPFGFAGGIYDVDTGLAHFGAREYDSELGRWTASDPIGFGGGDSNLYGYVLQDPVNLVDPSGLMGLGGELATRTVGVFDGVSFGVAPAARDVLGLEGGLDPSTPEYQQARSHGNVLSWLVPIGAAAKGAKAVAAAIAARWAAKAAKAAEAGKPLCSPIIPKGATGPYPTKGGGFQYVGGSGGAGLHPNVTGVRFMDATAIQPARRVYMNAQGQTVHPYTGRTISKDHPMAHLPR